MKNLKSIVSAILAISMTIATGSLYIYAMTDVSHDADGNRIINALDCAFIKRSILNNSEYNELSDTSHDSIVNYKDTIVMKEFLLHRTASFSAYPDEYILEPKGTVHTGEATYYGGGYVGGCASLDPVPDYYLITAMNYYDWNTAQLAGAYICATGERGSADFYVTDLLPEGKKGDLDLHVDAFPLVADPVKGRVPISWEIIPFDTKDQISYKFKEGSTKYWCGVQARNHRYPIAKFEFLNKNGEFIELERENYNYFTSFDMGEGPFTFRLTDIYGQVIVDTGIELIEEGIVEGDSQFPL